MEVGEVGVKRVRIRHLHQDAEKLFVLVLNAEVMRARGDR